MKIKKTRIYSSDIAVDVFYRRDIDFSKKNQAVIILPGFPDFIGASAMTNYQVSLGNIVFQPHIRGTFDSAGEFSPHGIKESFVAVNHMINNATGSKVPNGQQENQPWSISDIILVGHSFGGIMALRFFSEIQNLKTLIFTSPALHYSSEYGCKEIGPEHYNDVKRKYPFTYRLAPLSSWHGILEGNDPLPSYPLGKVDNVLIMYGMEDKYFDLASVSETAKHLVESYVSSQNCTLFLVKGAGHPVAELLSNEKAIEILDSICKG